MKTSRRSVLSALGLAPMLAPFVPVLEREGHAAGGPKRVVFMHTPNGLLRQELVPGNDNKFKRILEPLNRHKANITYVDGLHMNSFLTNPIPNDHPPPLGQVFTGADSVDPKDGKEPSASSSWFASDISIDQLLAKRIADTTRLAFPILNLGVDVGSYGWHMSHTGYRMPVFPDNDAAKVMSRLLSSGGTGTQPSPELQRMWTRRKSARDVARAELAEAMARVGKEDKARIERHNQLLSDLEKRETAAVVGGAGGSCKSFKQTSGDGDAFVKSGRLQLDNIALAFACDLTRVATLQWDISATYRKFPWVGVNDAHHELSHSSPTGNVYEGLTKIGAWYAEQFSSLIDRLKAMPEGSGTVFDSTLLVWMSEHSSSSGDHGRNNLPCILAGGLGGTLTQGRVLRLNRSHNDLFITVAQAMGFADVKTFGKASVCKGAIAELVA